MQTKFHKYSNDKPTIEEYLDLLKSYGFELVQKNEKENTNDYDFILYNKEKNMLVHGDTFNNMINSLKLFFNGKENDNVDDNFQIKKGQIGLSGGFISGSRVEQLYIDLRSQPDYKIELITKNYTTTDNFIEFNALLHSHIDGEIVNNSNKINKLARLPKDIRDKITTLNTDNNLILDIGMKAMDTKSFMSDYKIFTDLFTDKDLYEISIKNALLDTLKRKTQYMLTESLSKRAEVKFLNPDVLGIKIYKTYYQSNVKNKFSSNEIIFNLHLLTNEEKEISIKTLDSRFSPLKYSLTDDDKQVAIDKIKIALEESLKISIKDKKINKQKLTQ